jgi:hypothetical protein
MRVIPAPPPQPVAAVGVEFLRAVGAKEWRLVSEAQVRSFDAGKVQDLAAWVMAKQKAGKPVSVSMPTREGLHWWLAARLPAAVSPSAARPAPQWIIDTEAEWWLLWRLAQPVSTVRGAELLRPVIGKAGLPALGEPVPLPGSIVTKRIGKGLFARTKMMRGSRAPGYRVEGNALIPVGAKAAPKAARDPRRLSIEIAEGHHICPGGSSNGFFLLVGGSGGGKTTAIKRIAGDIGAYGVPLLTFDFHGDVAVKGTTRTLLSSGAASKLGLNPLEPLPDPDGLRSLHDQIAAFSDLLRRAYSGIGHVQAEDLRNALRDVYVRAGISDDPATHTHQPPTVAQLTARLEEMAEEDPKRAGKRIAGLLAIANGLFGNPIFHRTPIIATADLLSQDLHLDLSALVDSEKMVVTETLLLRVLAGLQVQGPIPESPVDDSERFRLCVVIDEAQKLGNSDVLAMLFKEARKFGLMMVVATQSASNLTQDVRDNAACWLALQHSGAAEAAKTAPSLGVKPEDLLALAPKGDGYLRMRPAPTVRIQVKRV